jgi:hypothetical protein
MNTRSFDRERLALTVQLVEGGVSLFDQLVPRHGERIAVPAEIIDRLNEEPVEKAWPYAGYRQ